MRIPQVRDYLVNLYLAEGKIAEEMKGAEYVRSSVMLLGQPGIGKTVSYKEAARVLAKALGRTFIEYDDFVAEEILADPDKYFVYHSLPLVECEPTDISGHPRLENGHAKYFPFLWMIVMQKCPGLLVLDDFLDVQRPDLFSAAYKVTLERRFGFLKYNDGVMVVAASNTAEYSSLSNALPDPLANRFDIRTVDPPTVDEWMSWMMATFGDKWDKTCYMFLKRFESEGYILKVPSEPETTENFPTHRSWTRVAVLSHQGVFEPEGHLGPEIGEKFRAFKAISVDIAELIAEPERWEKLELDAKYMACAMLSSWLDQQKKEDLPKSFPLLDAITADSREYFILICQCAKVSTLSKMFPQLFAHSKKYEKLARGTLKDRTEVLK
jgi:hypothetical protein